MKNKQMKNAVRMENPNSWTSQAAEPMTWTSQAAESITSFLILSFFIKEGFFIYYGM